jgi:ATP-dependent helicase HrpA
MWAGTRRLLRLTNPSPVALVNARLGNEVKLALSRNPHRSAADLMDDCLGAAIDQLMAAHAGPAWDEAGFAALAAAVRSRLADTLLEVLAQVHPALTAAHRLRQRLTGTADLNLLPALSDLRGQLDGLIHPGFVQATGWRRLPDLPRYLAAATRRLEKLPENPARDRQSMLRVHDVQQAYRELLDEAGPARRDDEALLDIRWMIEELRVSLFAQLLGTPYPVSEQRIYRAMDKALTG